MDIKTMSIKSGVLISILSLFFLLPGSAVADTVYQIANHSDSGDRGENSGKNRIEQRREELQQKLREKYGNESATSSPFASSTGGGILFRFGVFLHKNSAGVTIALFIAGLITSLLVGMLLKKPMKNGTQRVNTTPITTWGTGLAGLVIIGGLGKVFWSLLTEYFNAMAYSFIIASGIISGIGLLFLMSVYLATVFLAVLIGSWISNVVTNTSPKDTAMVQWWSIAAGYVIAFTVVFAFLKLFSLDTELGRTVNSVVFGLIVYPVLLGAVWQVTWSLGGQQYIKKLFSSTGKENT